MDDPVMLVLALLAGVVIGAVFFGGLWWTVRRGSASQRPALWFLGSLLLRMGFTIAGFLLVADGHWQRMLSCLAGFVIARLVVTSLTRPATLIVQDAGHAPQS